MGHRVRGAPYTYPEAGVSDVGETSPHPGRGREVRTGGRTRGVVSRLRAGSTLPVPGPVESASEDKGGGTERTETPKKWSVVRPRRRRRVWSETRSLGGSRRNMWCTPGPNRAPTVRGHYGGRRAQPTRNLIRVRTRTTQRSLDVWTGSWVQRDEGPRPGPTGPPLRRRGWWAHQWTGRGP